MKVVLRQEVIGTGEIDDVAEVSEGYARNYLFPRRLAVPATPKELALVEGRRAERAKQLAQKRTELEELAARINALTVTITADVGEEGKLFGSITPTDIAAALKTSAGLEIDKRKIELAEPIKVVGEHQAPIKLYKDLIANLKVNVTAK
jgi:large subunit ribosomal protein L9